VFTSPGQLSFDNYSALLKNSGMTQAFWNTVLISVPATVLVVVATAISLVIVKFSGFAKMRSTMEGL